MNYALQLAKLGEGKTRPNPLVGAVLVKNGQIVGEGYHKQYGGPHAESYAIEMAGEQAIGATLYVTLEPCSHFGKTPPCSHSIVFSGITRVVCAMQDPNPLVSGNGIAYLKEHGIDTSIGLLEQEALKLNEIFVHYITHNVPFVILKSAMSLDGKIATSSGESRWISSKHSREQVHEMRNKVSAIIVGVGTVLKDDPTLTTRLQGRDGTHPLRIVMDRTGRTPIDAQLFKTVEQSSLMIVTTKNIQPSKVTQYEQLGATVVVLNTNDRIEMVQELLSYLGQKGIDSILVEGGGTLAESFVQAKAVDKYIVYIAPMIIGGRNAPTPVEGEGCIDLSSAFKFAHVVHKESYGDILIEAYANTPTWEAI